MPKPEEVRLERTYAYLVREKKPDRAYAMFIDAIERGAKGYCITRTYPPKLRSKHDLGQTPILWLSNVRMEGTIRPKDLEELSVTLDKFLSADEGGVIMIDGLEYMITNNDFSTVLKLVQSLRDHVALKNAVLLICINPLTLDPHNLKLLEEEADVVM